MFAALPLLVVPVLIYNLIALTLPGGFSSIDAAASLDTTLFTVPMTSRVDWAVSRGELLLAVALIVLFVELLKSTNSRGAAIINHALSLLLFIGCLMEFLLGAAFATSTYFLITLMVLLDVLAGFIVTIVSARRDMDFTAGQS
jgi:hypothetical protein